LRFTPHHLRVGTERNAVGGQALLIVRSAVKRRAGLVIAVFLLGSLPLGAPAASQTPALPTRMAAIGDSITMATNVCCFYGSRPRHSWSIGWDPDDQVRSHYERILTIQPSIAGHNHNDARAGARMADARRQAVQAVSQQAHYVTILLGANDLCTSSPETMTSVATFRTGFRAALDTLTSGLPRARILVSSIPNIHRLWSIYRDNPIARLVWESANICQSMLSSTNTAEDRQRVVAREKALNDVLANVCASYVRCRFDGGAVYGYRFQPDQVSKLDYFHPNREGQRVIASLTWTRSWWAA
jgi:lysophospholipase L1-like esterase